MAKTKTRFAPSPTGFLHIGGLRTALYSFALAKHNKGDFVLRIEDTDKKRQVAGAEEALKKTLGTFGLNWDEYYVQSERLDLYKEAARRLLEEGSAYRDEGAVRLKIPPGETLSFYDFALGKEVSWKTETLKELVILKSDGFPTYHLAVVVDDHEMGITHVLRGHDWLPSTPIHLQLYKALGYPPPQIGHLSDILDPEGGKLSKRKGNVSAEEFLAEGYLPEAILNFIMLLGWAPKDNRELFSLEEFVKNFDPKGFQKANPLFNKEKLDWFNGHYIRQKSDVELASLLTSRTKRKEGDIIKIVPLVKDRIKKLSDFEEFAGFFFKKPKVDKKLFGKSYGLHLQKAIEAIENGLPLDRVPGDNNFKVGDFFMDLRIAVTGCRFTPPINESIVVLGKEETIKRLKSVA